MRRKPLRQWMYGGLVLGVALLSRPAAAEDATLLLQRISEGFADVAERSLPAVVSVRVERTIRAPGGRMPFRGDPFGFFGDEYFRQFFFPEGLPERHFRQRGQGSGFLISPDGFILTNHHVAGEADRIRVRLSDGREFDAQRIGSDPRSDLALLRIEGQNFPYLPIGDSDALRVGEWVIAIGNPFDLGETVTVGVVSAKGRSRSDIADFVDFIQTDAAINRGNSGGPLLNVAGKVVGINTAIYSQSGGGNVGIGFAIPIATAIGIKNQLMDGGKVTRGYLGIRIQDLTPELGEFFDIEGGGIVINDVETDSPAERAGLRPDDVVIKMNGADVGDVAAFRNRVANTPPGTDMKLTLVRDGERRTLTVRTGTLSEGDADPAPAEETADGILEKLGLEMAPRDDTPPRRASSAGGVAIVGVRADGPAAEAGLQVGDIILSVNRRPVTTVREVRQAIRERSNARSVLLKVVRGAHSFYVAVPTE